VPAEYSDPSLYIVEVCKPSEKEEVLSRVATVPTHCRVPAEYSDPSLYIVEVCKPSKKKERCCLLSASFRHTAECHSSFLTLHYIFSRFATQCKKEEVLFCVGTVPTHWCNSRVPFEFLDTSLYIVEVWKVSETKKRSWHVSELFRDTAECLSSFWTLHYILRRSARLATI
jgi:hypothetical protein